MPAQRLAPQRLAPTMTHLITRTVAILRAETRRFVSLDRARQVILLSLAIIGVVIASATIVYAIDPGNPDDMLATGFASSASGEAVGQQNDVSGDFVLKTGDQSPATLELHQYGANVVGTMRVMRCDASHTQPITYVVTGHFLNDGSLSLTSATPDQDRTSTTIYAITSQSIGLDMTLLDAAGHPQTQHWFRIPDAQYAAIGDQLCQG